MARRRSLHATQVALVEVEVLLLEGRLELCVGNKKYSLGRGDSFFFPSTIPHTYRNPGKVTARVVWINTPPTF